MVQPPVETLAPARQWSLLRRIPGGPLALASVVQAGAQLAVYLLGGRWLGSAGYSEAATLLGVLTFVGVPVVALQLAVAGSVLAGGGARSTLVRYGSIGVLAGAAVSVTAQWWMSLLNADLLAAARWVGLFVVATVMLSVLRGLAIAHGRLGVLASSVVANALTRLVAAAAGAAWFGAAGLVAGVVLAELSQMVVLLVVLRPLLSGDRSPAVRPGACAAIGVSNTAVWICTNVDVLWARRLLVPTDAGRYLISAGTALGLVSLGQTVLWSRVRQAVTPADCLRVARASSALVAAVSLVAVPLGAVLLPALMGADFEGLGGLLVATSVSAVIATAALSLSSAMLVRRGRALWAVIAVSPVAILVPWLVVSVAGATPVHLALAAAVNALLAAVVLAVPLIGRRGASW
jgi:hypothetical protein